MGRIAGRASSFQKYIKYLLILIALCFAVWATPRSIIATVSEMRAMGGALAPAARLPRRDVGEEHRGQHPDPHHLRELPALPPHRASTPTVSWAKLGNRAAGRDLRSLTGAVRDLPRHLRLLRRGRGAHRASRCRRCCSVLFAMIAVTVIDVLHVPERQGARRDALGPDPADLAVRADLHRGHLHLADGPHGLRALGAAPALARLRRHARHLGRRLHADARLRDPGGLGHGAHLLRC